MQSAKCKVKGMILGIGDRLLDFAAETIRLVQRLEGLKVRASIACGGGLGSDQVNLLLSKDKCSNIYGQYQKNA